MGGRLLASLVLLLVLTPAASAAVPLVARCNQVYCFSLFDEDADGVPDGFAGGTSELAHGTPTLQAGRTTEGTYAYTEVMVGEEDEGGPVVAPYAGAEDLSTVFVELVLADFDGETGQTTPVLGAQVWLEDRDGDGLADTPRLVLLP